MINLLNEEELYLRSLEYLLVITDITNKYSIEDKRKALVMLDKHEAIMRAMEKINKKGE